MTILGILFVLALLAGLAWVAKNLIAPRFDDSAGDAPRYRERPPGDRR